MSYTFTFDLSKLSRTMFKEIADFSEKGSVHEKIGSMARSLVKRFHVDEIIELPVCDSITVIEDIIDIHMKNSLSKKHFLQANKKALFLPHCCRKYMDSRCESDFDVETSSYKCRHCSDDCLINQATKLGMKEGYDVYVLPGGSCVRKILQKNAYDGIVGIACTDELKMATNILEQYDVPAQGIPLIKNGCSGTVFNMDTLEKTINDVKAEN